jgi:DNA-binding SARP family transcriptional activator
MRFAILGPIVIDNPAGPGAIRGMRRRALLLRLLLSANQLVPADRLAEDVWNGEPPKGAASTLTSHISLLRRLLGADRIANRSGGYCLRVDPGELDAVDFEDDLGAGREALRQGDPHRAQELLTRSLGYWRGSALVDVDGYAWARAEAFRLEELRLEAEDSLLEAKLALGHHREVVAAAEAAVGDEPLREQRWATLMLALYRSGRQSDALRAYQRLGNVLGEQLGLHPSPELAALERAIILHDPDLDWTPAVRSASDAVSGGPAAAAAPGPTLTTAEERGGRIRSTIPLPEALSQQGQGYVGRTVEQSELSAALARAVVGTRQVVLVGGEPGIGKTSLTAVVARMVEQVGGVALYGRCPEVGAPYQPFVDALGHYLQFAPRDELEAYVTTSGGELTRLVPLLAHRVPEAPQPLPSDPDTGRYLAFTAATALLAAAASRRPVLLVLDDLHWADDSTLALLRHLVRATGGQRLLILGTFRTNEVNPDHLLADTLAALWRETGVSRIELTGLSSDEVFELCQVAAGSSLDDQARDFVDELQRDTGGNPFFVGELLRHLVESGGLVRDGSDQWTADERLLRTGLPASLREVIGQRVEHLGPEVGRLLSVASVIGPEFHLAALARAASLDIEGVLDLLEAAERSELLTETGISGTFAFAHALTRNALYDGLGQTRRRLLHASVAAALEEGVAGPAPPGLLAHHFGQAGEPGPALHYAELAGYDALAAVAPNEAARWFDEARTLLEAVQPGDSLRQCDFTIQLGMAQQLSGDPAHRQTLLDAGSLAEVAGDPRRMAVAALANSRGYYAAAGQIDRERTAALQAALDRLGDTDRALRVRLSATLCSEMAFESPLAERIALADETKEEARALDDPEVTVSVLNLVIEALRHPSLLEQCLDDTGLALRLAERVGDPAALFGAVGNRMRIVEEAGRVDEAVALFERLESVTAEVNQPVMVWLVLFNRAHRAFMRGATDEGERLAVEALEYGLSVGQPDAVNYFATQISHARWQQGRLGEIVGLIEDGARDNPGIPGYRAALARALCQAGQVDEATALLDEAADRRFVDLPEDSLWLYGLVNFAEAAIRLDHGAAAAALVARLAPFDRQLVCIGTSCEGPVAHYLGALFTVLGCFDEATVQLRVAAGLATAAGSPYFMARTLIEQGHLAWRQGDGDGARRLLDEGGSLADRWGFAGEVARAGAMPGVLGA